MTLANQPPPIGYATMLAFAGVLLCFAPWGRPLYAEPGDPGPANEAESRLLIPPPSGGEIMWSRWLAQELDAEAEHQTYNQRRVDVLTSRRAIEVEWCKRSKVAECVRQARYYGVATGRPSAIVLLVGRGSYEEERVVYDLVVEEAARSGVMAVSVLDVREPNVGACCEHLGLVPTEAKP